MNSNPTSEVLSADDIRLTLTGDREYLSSLMRSNRYNHLSDYGIRHYLNFVKYVWVGETRGVVGGVVYFSLLPHLGGWAFDAYKEDEKLKLLDNRGDFGYKASLMALDWFRKELIDTKIFAIFDKKNRGAKWLAKRLGFREVNETAGFVTMRKEI